MKNQALQIVLASASPYKKKQLETLRLPFICATPGVDETPLPQEDSSDHARRLAELKARAIVVNQDSLIIACDQSAEIRGSILGKALTREKAAAQLLACSGQKALFHSAVAVLNTHTSELKSEVTTTTVQFRHLSEREILHYLDREYVLDCAGSFKAEALGIALFEAIESSDPSALIGLPLIALNSLLIHNGVNALLYDD